MHIHINKHMENSPTIRSCQHLLKSKGYDCSEVLHTGWKMAAIPYASHSEKITTSHPHSLCFLLPSSGQWHFLIFYSLCVTFSIFISHTCTETNLICVNYMSRCDDVQINVRYFCEIILTANFMKWVEMLTHRTQKEWTYLYWSCFFCYAMQQLSPSSFKYHSMCFLWRN